MTCILGNGVAANCCAHLLKGVPIHGDQRPKIPALVVSSATQALIEDVFQRTDVFSGATKISKRIVRWGDIAQAIEVSHSAVVISEEALVAHVSTFVDFQSHGFRPSQHCFGTRMATAFPVVCKVVDACWIESTDAGWLFLVPGWLLSVGEEGLLERSRMIAPEIESIGEPVGRFPAYPRISDPLCEKDWLAAGGAAMSFDPICGDGVGNAIREAILACAVIKASKDGDPEALLVHYRTRLVAGFLKHLELCRPFYAACSGAWWAAELAQLDEGIAWCRTQLGDAPKYRYQLRGFDLQMIS